MIHDIRAYQESVATQEESGCLEEATLQGHGAVRAAEEIETEVTETMHWITHANGQQLRNAREDLGMAIRETPQDDML